MVVYLELTCILKSFEVKVVVTRGSTINPFIMVTLCQHCVAYINMKTSAKSHYDSYELVSSGAGHGKGGTVVGRLPGNHGAVVGSYCGRKQS